MNKIAIIALATLLIVGISFQAKRVYDRTHSHNESAQNSNGDANSSATVNGSDEQNKNSGDAKYGAQNGSGENGSSPIVNTETDTVKNANGAAGDAQHAGTGTTGSVGSAGANGDAAKTGNGTVAGNAMNAGGVNGNHATEASGTGAGNATQTSGSKTDHANAGTGTTAKGMNAATAKAASGTSKITSAKAEDEDADMDSDQPATDTSKKTAKAASAKAKENCFAFEFRHKKDAGEQDIENFLDHTNAFPIAHADYNPKSLCVKVNQKTVSYQISKYKQSPEVRVGALVGPESVIRVSYCVGKINPCHEKCEQPKKRFMDELMSENTDDDSFSDSWGKDGADKAKKDLKNKAKELRAIASENDHLNEGSIQRDWESLQKQEWVCK